MGTRALGTGSGGTVVELVVGAPVVDLFGVAAVAGREERLGWVAAAGIPFEDAEQAAAVVASKAVTINRRLITDLSMIGAG